MGLAVRKIHHCKKHRSKNLKNFKLNPVTLYTVVTMFHIGEIHGVSHELQQKRAQYKLSSVKYIAIVANH